jgi:hypothetical protein
MSTPPTASLRGDYQPKPTGEPAEGVEATPLPNYTLFSPKQIGVIGFLGGPLGAGFAFWSNWKRQGHAGKALVALIGGVVATVVLCLVAMKLPEHFPRMAIPAAYTIAIFQYARATETAPFERHLALQGRAASNWTAFGISIASLVAAFGMLIGVALLSLPPKISAGTCDVYYLDGGTKQEAQRLGAELVAQEYCPDDRGVTVSVKRAAGRHVIAFVLNDKALVDPAIADGFRAFAPILSKKAFDGEPVDIWLNDDVDRTKVRLMWESPAVAPQ